MNQDLTKDKILSLLQDELPALKREFGVEQIALFGSFAHGKPNQQSDVDLMVRLSKPLGLQFITLADRLEAILGRPIDIITFESLNANDQNLRRSRVKEEIKRTLVYA
jgi:hypothetical protein